jgi:hypothetical protein
VPSLRTFREPTTTPPVVPDSNPTFHLSPWSKKRGPLHSPRFNELILKQTIERQIRVVFLIAMWPGYANDPQFGPCLKETVSQLTNAGIEVVIVRHVAMQNVNVPRALTRAVVFGHDVQAIGVPLKQHRQMNIIADAAISQVASKNVTILDPTPYFVGQTGLYRAEMDGVALYADTQHLSPAGARRLKPLLAPTFSGVRNADPDHRSIR